MPPEPCGARSAGEAGFTLLELLVCLVLMATIAAFALPRFANERGMSFDRRVQVIAADLARLRERAIGTGAVQRAASSELAAVLPPEIGLGDTVPGEIVFFPNGMANGAVWRLEAEGQAVDLEVDWLTGRITLHAR